MMTDPYAVLGLSPGASDDEVKAAYRKLAKKYHPDMNQGDPSAEQRMKEINEAYDIIMRKKDSASSGTRDYSGYAQNAGASGQDSAELRAARAYIAAARYYEAINALSSVASRTAEWYYLTAVANAGLGNRIDALRYAQQAVAMDPYNMQYRSLLQQLQGYGETYQTYSRRYAPPATGLSGLCMGLCLARMFCPYCFFC